MITYGRPLVLTGALLVFLAVYVPRAGQGFISDDFEWALRNQIRSTEDVERILTQHNGFYRPIVALTFSANEWLSGTGARGYGLANVFLALGCALAAAYPARSIGLSWGAGLFAASVWLSNVHGINMAVLWLAGRTALLLTLASVMSIATLARGRLGLALVWMALAVCSKEEAVLLPAVGAAWVLLLCPQLGRPFAIKWLMSSGAIVLVYLAVRSTTGAMTPFTAPSYYQPTFSPFMLARNVVEYADRALTVSLVVGIGMVAILGNLQNAFDARTMNILRACGIWLAGTFAITVFLPVRSSLYVCLPSVAAAIALAAVGQKLWPLAGRARQHTALGAALMLQAVMYPVHVARAERYVGNARFSTAVLQQLSVAAAAVPEGSAVIVHDDRANRINMQSAFGNLLDEAYRFHTGRRLDFWIEPPVAYATPSERPCDACVAAEFKLEGADVRRVR